MSQRKPGVGLEAIWGAFNHADGLSQMAGKPFAPDARMKGILEKAAKLANARMRVQAYADRRPDRVV